MTRSALVTGATRGIGRAIAIGLARNGWTTHALGRSRMALEELRAEHGLLPIAMDLTDRDEMRALVGQLKVDVLIHAPQLWRDGDGFTTMSEADIDMALEVNLSTALHMTLALAPQMEARGGGSIVMVASRPNRETAALPRLVEAALCSFAETLSSELASKGISLSVAHFEPAVLEQSASEIIVSLSSTQFHSGAQNASAACSNA